jgi:hypothetical protein
MNSLVTGAMNFCICYGREIDIVKGLPFEEKFRRVANIMEIPYLSEDYYRTFQPDYRAHFRKVARSHAEEELRRVEGVGHFFSHERDVFSFETRIHRLTHQYDLNKVFYNSHHVMIDDEIHVIRDQMPANWQVQRKVYRHMFQKLLPDLARIKYQKTGLDLFHYPSEARLRRRRRMERLRYLVGRASLGQINLKDRLTYLYPDAWYREHPENRRFFETILLDDRTEQRDYYEMDVVRTLLAKQRRGGDYEVTLAALITFELFNRYFVDGDSPPRIEELGRS